MNFGERLRELRATNYLSKSKLLEELGVCRQMLAKYENNEATPTVALFTEIAKYFNVSADYLLGLDDYNKHTDEKEKKCIILPDELTVEDYALIKDFIKTVSNRRLKTEKR